MKPYQPLHGLPPLAGLATFEEAQRPGFSIEECVKRLKRYHYAFKRLHEIFIARLTAEPIYELKMAFSLHAHYCAEHAAALRLRVGEMREPPLGLDVVPDENLALFFDEILGAPTTAELVGGLYTLAVPALRRGLEAHIALTNPLVDHPSIRLCRFALLEVREMEAYGRLAFAGSIKEAGREPTHDTYRLSGSWSDLLAQALRRAGGLSGDETDPAAEPPIRRYSAQPFQYDGTPRRDERFPDPYNMGVNAEAFLYDASLPPEPKVLMMFYKRLREIDVPEMMASIITETKGKPWGYYRDMTRQLWDEARHAMMGEVGFVASGLDWPERVMINFTWSLGLNTQLTPRERHGVLYFIEQGLMPKTGKRFEWETAQASGSTLSTLFQDYDWADEVLHARVGRDWYVSTFENPKEAVEWGDRCWSKVVMGWSQWRDEGLTGHRNWWPEVYGEYCAQHGLEPEPAVLAFDTSYETQRADLKVLSGSG
ncbi:MAG TPA: hypothetical protein VGO11_13595 [Chthoniobacteraceae bacterium]|jgi:hypothetical protein|nr:hypothetical protein [Chthoniobacteraceae bacterium]